ncbi:MAG TPA: DPP IV N-terminal domain-containing protein, partial [Bacteroidota bacterium]|nr:DPP IV N-terminal domain-containing protein [Bacteroidota bacterium]
MEGKGFLMRVPAGLLLECAVFMACAGVVLGGEPGITIDWMFDGGASRVEAVPQTLWLSGGRLLVYDTLSGDPAHPFRSIDPATGSSLPALDAGRALVSLRDAAGAAAPGVIPWPAGIDAAGEKAVYLFGGDVFVLDFRSSRFLRLTRTPEEESAVSISPDGNWIAWVRANDIYLESSAGGGALRLTHDGSGTTLNGKFSWVYWEEIFGHHDN